MVRFILGRAGKGKTSYIFNDIASHLKSSQGKKMILLVPEQYTLQAERDLIEHLRLPGLIQLEVLSITRLAERVFEETGRPKRLLINEQGRQMALRKVVDEIGPGLSVYARASRQPGFINQCAELLSEFKQNMIQPEDLLKMQQALNSNLMLREKLQDTAIIYQSFNQFMSSRQYLDNDDYLLAFIDRMHQSISLPNSLIWVDSFVTFSPLTFRIVKELMLLSCEISIALTIDPQLPEREAELFEPSREVLQRFQNFTRQAGLRDEIIAISPRQPSPEPAELTHLEAELMAFPARCYPGEVNTISVTACSNIYSEAEKLAREIIHQARDGGLRWRDMAVVCGDLATYGPLLKRTFEEYGIPCFLDAKRSIMNNPLIRCILSLIDTIQNDYQPVDIMSYLKTGLTMLSRSECEVMENYLLRFGIKGRRWKKPFRWGTDPEQNKMENLRLTIMDSLIPLETIWKDESNCRVLIASLYSFMHSQGFKERMEVQIDRYMQQGLWEPALESAQIWNIVGEILEQLAVLTGDMDISLSQFRQLLETGLRSYELGIIPPTVDQVLVGSITRSKSQKLRILFVVGANDGILPATANPSSLLNNEERILLSEQGLVLGWNASSRIREENLLIYHVFSQPRNYLHLSWPVADIDGKALRPSLIIRQIQRLFPRLSMQSDLLGNQLNSTDLINTPGGTFKYLVRALRQSADLSCDAVEWQSAVYDWYRDQPGWFSKLKMIKNGLYLINQEQALPPQIVDKLFSEPLFASVSRLERFVLCPFAHFLNYGLEARERQIYTIEAPDLGDFYHSLLYEFSSNLVKMQMDWQHLDPEGSRQILEQVLQEMVPVFGDGILESSYRYRYLARRLERISLRTIKTLSQELQRSNFTPLDYELRFGRGRSLPPLVVKLNDSDSMYIEGRIDRVDVFEDETRSYIRIVDYKSGRKDLHLSDVYHGLSLQLLVYLKATLEGKSQNTANSYYPAGVLYIPIDDPLVKTDSTEPALIEGLLARELRFRGLVLEDVDLIRNMDREMESGFSYLPVNLNKDFSFSRTSSILNQQGFSTVFKYLDLLLQRIGRELRKGRIDIAPVKTGSRTACQICNYRSVCQFDRRLPGNRYRVLKSFNREEALQRMIDEVDINEEME